MTVYVNIHALQGVPFNCLNRDDTGTPKTGLYGGAERIRVSSQSWKRAARHDLESRLGDRAVRTRRAGTAVASRLTAQGWDAELAAFAGQQVIAASGVKTEDDQTTSSAMFFLPESGLDELAEIAAAHRSSLEAEHGKKKPGLTLPKDKVAAVFRSRNASIALLGRMLAELPGANVDGCVQWADAFTTHASVPDVDFFTAVDDLAEGAGSAHMGDARFSAGTFYRYANVNVDDLARNLDGDLDTVREVTAGFLRAFATSLPTGKQSTTGAQSVPFLVYCEVRTGRPVSLAEAFEEPVRSQVGYDTPSLEALSLYAQRLHEYWGTEDLAWNGHAVLSGKTATGLGDRVQSVPVLLDSAVAAAFPGQR